MLGEELVEVSPYSFSLLYLLHDNVPCQVREHVMISPDKEDSRLPASL